MSLSNGIDLLKRNQDSGLTATWVKTQTLHPQMAQVSHQAFQRCPGDKPVFPFGLTAADHEGGGPFGTGESSDEAWLTARLDGFGKETTSLRHDPERKAEWSHHNLDIIGGLLDT